MPDGRKRWGLRAMGASLDGVLVRIVANSMERRANRADSARNARKVGSRCEGD